ncbi:20909_t:CDS:1, partial [Cetraspora pellucida]
VSKASNASDRKKVNWFFILSLLIMPVYILFTSVGWIGVILVFVLSKRKDVKVKSVNVEEKNRCDDIHSKTSLTNNVSLSADSLAKQTTLNITNIKHNDAPNQEEVVSNFFNTLRTMKKSTNISTPENKVNNIFTSEKKDTNIFTSEKKDTNIFLSEKKDTNIFTSEKKDTNIFTSEKKDTNIFTSEKKGTNIFTSEKKGTNIFTSEEKDTNIFTSEKKDTNIFTSEKKDTKIFASEKKDIIEKKDGYIHMTEKHGNIFDKGCKCNRTYIKSIPTELTEEERLLENIEYIENTFVYDIISD